MEKRKSLCSKRGRCFGARIPCACAMIALGLASLTRRWSTPGETWYENGKQFWAAQTAKDDNGVLCGSASVHEADIADSRRFLHEVYEDGNPIWPPTDGRRTRALDVGAGIGRVSRDLLLKECDLVDLVDGNINFIEQAKATLSNRGDDGARGLLGRCIVADLQSYVPDEKCQYDLIWIQWVSCHLKDDDLVHALSKFAGALAPGGLIVLKDNVFERGGIGTADAVDGRYLVGEEDSSVVRTKTLLVSLATSSRSGLRLVASADAELADPSLYPVVSLALRRIRSENL